MWTYWNNRFGFFFLNEPVVVIVVDVEGELQFVLDVSLGENAHGGDELAEVNVARLVLVVGGETYITKLGRVSLRV